MEKFSWGKMCFWTLTAQLQIIFNKKSKVFSSQVQGEVLGHMKLKIWGFSAIFQKDNSVEMDFRMMESPELEGTHRSLSPAPGPEQEGQGSQRSHPVLRVLSKFSRSSDPNRAWLRWFSSKCSSIWHLALSLRDHCLKCCGKCYL